MKRSEFEILKPLLDEESDSTVSKYYNYLRARRVHKWPWKKPDLIVELEISELTQNLYEFYRFGGMGYE